MKIDELITHTGQLVAIPSVAGNTHALHQAVDSVADFVATQTNVTIERFEQNGKPSFLAYKGGIRPAKFDLILNGHVDVVPALPEQFTPIQKDGKLYGRGTLDMKGTTMVLASLFAELVNSVSYTLGLQIVSDEESGGTDGTLYQFQQGVRADMVVMGEYGNEPNTIYNAARGTAPVEVAIKGQSSHSAHPWKGSNAIVNAAEFILALQKKYPTPTMEAWTETASVNLIATDNEGHNVVPDYVTLLIDFRFTNNDEVFHSREALTAMIQGLHPAAEVITIRYLDPAVYVPTTHSYVEGLAAAIHQATSQEVRYRARPGSSDGRHLVAYSTPSLEFGLLGDCSHTENEYVEIESFASYYNIMRAFLLKPKI